MTRAVASKLAVATTLAGVLLAPERATAQLGYEIVHSFAALPASPNSRLLQATDGTLYGTTVEGAGTIFALRPRTGGGFSLTILHEFDMLQGSSPSGLIQARDGNLYGTTNDYYPSVGKGTVFKVTPAGVFTTLHTFAGPDRAGPGVLVQATDGSFYGMTFLGGAFNLGTVFRMTAGGTLTTVHSFTGGSDGSWPEGTLLQATDGAFYGTTSGDTFFGTPPTIFRITPDGTLTTLYAFAPFEGPPVGLVQGTDGAFYGTSYAGLGGSRAFKLTPGGVFTYIHTFPGSEGWAPVDPLLQASDGNFYGTMSSSGTGPDADGTAYRMTPAGEVTVLHTFTLAEGGAPPSGLIQARDGRLYGVAKEGGPFGLGTVFSMDVAGAFTTVQAFRYLEGCHPWGGLIEASDGAFYGTTRAGGLANKGTIYKMTASGMVTTLHTFTGADGAAPLASLLQASDGNFYGTTYLGGSSQFYQGTVFRMTPAGLVTTLHSFFRDIPGGGADGTYPWAPLIQASDGNLYGTTSSGGWSDGGTLFRMSLSGSYTGFYTFSSSGSPVGPLIQARDGFLYGTGYGRLPHDGGIVFRVTPGGITVLSTSGADDFIAAGLTEGSDGSFYSASFGANAWPPRGPQPAGSVFKITPEGVKTILHPFSTSFTEGIRPFNAPIEASDGNFYGTTHRYRNDSPLTTWGSIYQVTPTGSFTTLKALSYAEGAHPSGKLLQASDGALYGVSYMGGGPGDCGAVFRFTIP